MTDVRVQFTTHDGNRAAEGPVHSPPVETFDMSQVVIDDVSCTLLAFVMAGRITRADAHSIQRGTLKLEDAVVKWQVIHERFSVPHIPEPKVFGSIREVREAHVAFKAQLTTFDICVQGAFSVGRVTFWMARYAHLTMLTRKTIRRAAANDWKNEEPNLQAWSLPFIPYIPRPSDRRVVGGSGLCGAFNYE